MLRRQDPALLARQSIEVATESLDAFLDGYRDAKHAEMRSHLRDSPEDLRALALEIQDMRVALEAVDDGQGLGERERESEGTAGHLRV